MRPPLLLLATLVATLTASAQVPSYVPTDGLVAWYPLNGNITNEANPSVYDGLSFNGNYITDRNGQAQSAIGLPSNQLLQLPLNPAILSNEFTLAFWVYTRSNSIHNEIQIGKQNGPGRANFGLTSSDRRPYVSELTCGGTYGDCGNSSVQSTPLNSWFHLTYVIDGVNTKIYVDGQDLGMNQPCTVLLDCNDPIMSLWFGGDVTGGATEYFNGDFDDIGIWSRALSTAEIEAIHNSNEDVTEDPPPSDPGSIPDYVPTDGLMAWYPFNANTLDASGNGHHGIPEGTSFTADRFGVSNHALNFDGVNDELDMPNFFNTGWAEYSISGWFATTDINKNNQTILNTQPHNSLGISYNYVLWPPHCVAFGLNTVPTQSSWDLLFGPGHSQTSYPNTEWHHLILTKNNLEYTLIIDGLVEYTTVVANTPADFFCGIRLGHIDVATGEYFRGNLDDFGFWNRELSTTEITALLTGITPVPGCTDNTACNYDTDANMDDGSCIPSGCMEDGACNYNADAQCEGEACDYSCCPGPGCCGPGTTWDPQLQTCISETPPAETAENCTLFNLQELSIGYLQLAEQNAAQDTLIITQQAEIDSLNALLNNCTGNN